MLTPADVPLLSPLRYVVPFVAGGYVGAVGALGVHFGPSIVSRPPLLALVVLLALVGGPLSLLYRWPMLRDPAQRPALETVGWVSALRRGPSLLAGIGGALLVPVTLATVGWVAPYGLVVFVLFLPLILLGAVDVEGELDPDAGVLRVNQWTVETALIAGVSTRRLGTIGIVRLRYEPGTSRFGKPWVFVVPSHRLEGIRSALSRAVADRPPAQEGPRERSHDPLARAVLAGAGMLFLAVGIVGALAVEPSTRPLLLGVTVLLGVPFLLAAYDLA